MAGRTPIPVLAVLVVLGALPWIIAAAPANPDDAAAMQSIANTTGAARSLGWGVKSADPCDGAWAGVSCDSAGRVTSIRAASRSGLVGWLHAPDLSKLTFLVELDLGFNSLTGQTGGDLPLLPAPLQHLRALDLRSNRFLDVPDGFFAAFPALETINLDDNPMVGPKLRQDLLTCSRLRSFSANNISLSPFPDYLGSTAAFPALESLSLARNALHGAIPAGFGSNSNIKFLDVGGQSSILTGRIDHSSPA
ncbi:hypothetical protein GQ55_9G125000 [Panicum hallii var. hallii]|uniref:Leucine-rich repeat-containing N-terminal plant-type domain-containing protein n=1 Tax=Panicum hallii var. hallii TaxID=1504633 RepID=A0A2T7C2N4_9POAL|nr:hypothetical protein GQ55_9G125000 [Panicum hallii var. hallii]